VIILKSARELDYMREAGRIVAGAFQAVQEAIRPGVTTKELDRIVEDYITGHGAYPTFKGYQGFPASICASVNEEVVHGIPGLRPLEDGDIISIDIGAVIHGYNGDAAQTFPVGKVTPEKQRLIDTTRESLYMGIKEVKLENRLSDVSHAIQEYVEARGYSVVRDYVGHGIGTQMHEDPQIPNFGSPGRGPRLLEGMVLAIEPMVNEGTYRVRTLSDHWTVVTTDGKPSAHFEHTVAVTPDGPWILTEL